MKTKLLILSLLCSVVGWGQFNIAAGGTNYTQDFNTLTAGAWADNTTLTGWYARTDATSVIATYGANTGTTTTAGLYAFGVAGTNPLSDRGLGWVVSNAFTGAAGTGKAYVGWRLKNNTGSAISSLTVTWTGEQWRRDNTVAHSLSLFYQTGATVSALTGGTWTAAPSTFSSPNIVGAAAALDGNTATNRTANISVTISVNIPAGNEIMLRWEDLNDAGNDHLMAVDDVTVNATLSTCSVPSTQASALTTTGETLDGFTVNWTAGNGNGTMIVVSDAAVVAPTSGTAYTANLNWATAGQINTNNRVIFRGAGATAGPITGLASGAQYSVRAYEYNATGDCYATPGATATGYTRALEPTSHAASFSCTTASSSQINLSFSAASTITNASGYLILQSTTGVPTGLPTDGVIYTAGAIIGDATVVGYASAAATTFNVTGLLPSTTYYYTLIPYGAYLSVAVTANYYINPTIPSTNCTTTGIISSNSDVIAVAASEAATIASTVNDAAPLTSTTGVQVWQFKVRDGGATLSDTDLLPTIVTALTFAQSAGNQVTTWSDAINTVELFDGTTRIAAATVTANQIQFTGLTITVLDNTEKTLTLRMSLKCPLGAGAADGNDFGFSLSNANTTFSAAGSGKAAFTAQVSANGSNVIQVVATQLSFTTQPSNTGVNATMNNVVVSATDACGNIDKDFTGTVNLTSTGTMTGAPISVSAVAGVATYVGIIHTVIGSGYTMNASSVGLTAATSALFDIVNVTTLNRGDLAILAVNTNLASNPGNDQIAFVCFQDILPGTKIYLTDNGYQRQFANEWGGTEGVISITRTGSTLTKGTIIVIEGNVASGNIDAATEFDVYTCGAMDANWSKSAISGGGIGGFNLNSNDDVWIMQGGTWTNSTTHHSTYDGNVLYGWTESGWDAAPGGASQSTQWSTMFPTLECYNTVAPTGGGKVKFNDPVNPDFSTITNGKLDWIALINNFANWDTYTTDALYNAGGFDYKGNNACPQMTIANVGYVNGKWTGRVDTNWFNCGNWDTLVVPDATVDVQVGDNTFNNQAIVDATAPQSDYYGDIARSRNLTITGEKVEITTALTNVLEVHGDLLIDGPAGNLDMNGGGASDGHLMLYGNWTNTMGNVAFDEGNGTVTFTGSTPQIINNVTPEGTETFHNLILNNNFTTNVSNDIIANGDLTINATKTLTVSPGDYAQVTNNVTNNGTFTIENTGSLIQINDLGVNSGALTMKRTASQRLSDYVYWSSPVANFGLSYFTTTGGTPASNIFQWGATTSNPNGGEGYWSVASGNMTTGQGYIIRGSSAFSNTAATSWDANFNGVANNGIVTVPIARGNDYTGIGTQGIMRTANDDNWNLIGNPYPSAIGVNEFLSSNADIDGFVKIWTHGNLPTSIVDPFYQDFILNYFASDYTTVNSTGLTSGPGDYKIGAGQGFFVSMVAGLPGSSTVTFNNAMRSRTFANNQFYRSANSDQNTAPVVEKNRIWLDLISPTQTATRTLVGYVDGATNQRDRLFDAITDYKNAQNFYSLLDADIMSIQGKAIPFEVNDQIPLGMKVPTNGTYTIAIAAVDGLFANNNQKIFLEDKVLQTIHEISALPYTFTTNQGIINDRFVLRYANPALSTNDSETNDSVSIYNASNTIKIVSTLKNIKNVSVYNVLGQNLASKITDQKEVIITSIPSSNQALVVKVILENDQVITKKLLR